MRRAVAPDTVWNDSEEVVDRLVAIADLQAHPRNYKGHPIAQLERIAASLRAFGQVRTVAVWRGVILAGHGVTAGAELAGWSTVRASIAPDAWTAERAAAYLVADNETQRGSDTDIPGLAALVDEGRALFDIAAMGFDHDGLDELLASMATAAPPPTPGAGGDDFDPDAAGPTRAQPGDLWILGGVHRLIVGDAGDPATVDRLLQGERPDVLWADPPFGIEYTGHGRSKDGRANKFAAIAGDEAPDPGWVPLWLPAQGAVYVKTTWAVLRAWEAALVELCRLRSRIVWDKCSHVAGDVVGGYATQSEIVLFGSVGDHKIAQFDTDVWRIPRATTGAPERRTGHPYESPIALPLRAIMNSAPVGGLVVDPFLGSGPTVVAAHRAGRRCYGTELEPAYADMALRRAEAEGLPVERVS